MPEDSVMARRADHSRAEIKAMALAAARDLVREAGMTGLSTRKIAARIGYTIGTLYNVFADLDDLVLHVNAATLAELEDALATALAAAPRGGDTLAVLAETYLRQALTHPADWHVLFRYPFAPDRTLPAWYQERINRLLDLVKTQLQASCADPVARHQHAVILLSGLHGLYDLLVTEKLQVLHSLQITPLIQLFVRTYGRGLAAGETALD
jgi:AcrR family transcriptional regulator